MYHSISTYLLVVLLSLETSNELSKERVEWGYDEKRIMYLHKLVFTASHFQLGRRSRFGTDKRAVGDNDTDNR